MRPVILTITGRTRHLLRLCSCGCRSSDDRMKFFLNGCKMPPGKRKKSRIRCRHLSLCLIRLITSHEWLASEQASPIIILISLMSTDFYFLILFLLQFNCNIFYFLFPQIMLSYYHLTRNAFSRILPQIISLLFHARIFRALFTDMVRKTEVMPLPK